MIKEFECTDISHKPVVFEKRFSSYEHFIQCTETHKAVYCPECGDTQNVKVLISNTAKPQFRGSGFYETDYKK